MENAKETRNYKKADRTGKDFHFSFQLAFSNVMIFSGRNFLTVGIKELNFSLE